jgi:hypothetical protein
VLSATPAQYGRQIAAGQDEAGYCRLDRPDQSGRPLQSASRPYRGRDSSQPGCGFGGLADLNKMIASFLGVSSSEFDTSDATMEFESTFADANAAIDEVMAPASKILEPLVRSVQPGVQALEVEISEKITTSRITASEANELRKAGYAGLYEPFRDKVDALQMAQKHAMAVYDHMMVTAVDRFSAAIKITDSPAVRLPSSTLV